MDEMVTAMHSVGAQSSESAAESTTASTGLSEDLVRTVADRVYALWLVDLKVARDRAGIRTHITHDRQGGSLWR